MQGMKTESKCNVLLEFLGKNGSGVYFTLEMACAFAHNGINVYVLLSEAVMNRDQWLQMEQRTPNMHAVFIETGNKKTILWKSLDFLARRGRILKALKSVDFQFALRTFPHPWLEFVETCLHVEKVFFILHDPEPHTGTEWYRRVIARRSVKTASDIIVMSRKFQPIVCRNFGVASEHVYYMKHGLLPPHPTGKAVPSITSLDCDAHQVNFLFFGRIDKYKGLHTLAEAYRNLTAVYGGKIGLIVAGSGDFSEYRAEYSSLDGAEIFNEYVTDDEMDALFRIRNTVVILPYTDATQSGVIPVATEYGCPIIASNTGGLWEQLEDGSIGLFFQAGNAKDLEGLMERFVTDDGTLYLEQREKMLALKQSLSWDNIVADLLKKIT